MACVPVVTRKLRNAAVIPTISFSLFSCRPAQVSDFSGIAHEYGELETLRHALGDSVDHLIGDHRPPLFVAQTRFS
jgi:hypothetical protein